MKIKNKERKATVEEYQKQVQTAIDKIKSKEGKLNSVTKEYINNLEDNIKRAPYVLGYLFWDSYKS